MVDLAVTMVIVMILAGIAVPTYGKYLRKVKMAEAQQNVGAISQSQHTYYLSNKEFRWMGFNPFNYFHNYKTPNLIESLPSWQDIGNPIAVGTPVSFVYYALPGKVRGDGTCVNRGYNAQNNSTEKPLWCNSMITLGRNNYDSTSCGSFGFSSYIKPCQNGNSNCSDGSFKPHYNWLMILSWSNLKVTGQTSDSCSTVFRVMDTDPSTGTLRKGNIQILDATE